VAWRSPDKPARELPLAKTLSNQNFGLTPEPPKPISIRHSLPISQSGIGLAFPFLCAFFVLSAVKSAFTPTSCSPKVFVHIVCLLFTAP